MYLKSHGRIDAVTGCELVLSGNILTLHRGPRRPARRPRSTKAKKKKKEEKGQRQWEMPSELCVVALHAEG